MKADVGSLLFIEDKNNKSKRRPFICVYVFKNKAGIPYDWLIIPITSTRTVGDDNLVRVEHKKLCLESYAKISNIESISWRDEIEVAKQKFDDHYVKDITKKLNDIFKT